MSSRSEARVAAPSWGRRQARGGGAERARRLEPVRAAPPVRWGVRAPARSDALGAAVLAATAGLWAAFLLAVW